MPTMFYCTSDTNQCKLADSPSTDDHRQYHYVRQRSRKSLPSSPPPSNLLHMSADRHPDNTPGRILASFSSHCNLSAQSSPVTSPSSPHDSSSHFADSQSSLTSEFAGADLSRSGCDHANRVPAIMRPPNFGTPPSPVTGRSRSITESDLRFPTIHAGSTRNPVSTYYPASSSRPRTAPHPSSPVVSTENPVSHVSMAIKFLLSKPALPLPTRSLHSSSASEASSPSQHTTPRKLRPHPIELDVSASPFSPGYSHPGRTGAPFVSKDSLQSPSSSSTHVGEQKPRNVLRRKPSAKGKEKERVQREIEKKMNVTASRSTHRSVSVTTPKESPPAHTRDRSMTPVSTGIQAYKQRKDPSSVQLVEACPMDEPVSPSPYHTIYRTRSEHKVTTDGPDDTRQWSLHGHVLAGPHAQIRPEEPSRPLSRKGSLTKMISSRWKKATGSVGKADESQPSPRGHSKSRSSVQERCSLRDGRGSIHIGEFGTDLHQTRSVTEPRSKLKEDPVEGSKIWRLVKRISTGGMRERFIADKAAPPVPAIPKELLSNLSPQSRALRVGPQKPRRPSTPKNIVNAGPRPSIATSSSSPNSSDVASAHFFQKSHSRRSSVSSYGEEIAPLPGLPGVSQGDHHIVPPRELHQIAGDQENDQDLISRSGSYIHSGQATPKTEGKANSDDLHPRVVPPGDDPWEMSPRTVSTSSVTTSLTTRSLGVRPPTVAHAQLLPDGNVSLSPPPRPIRSMMRSSRGSQNDRLPCRTRPATADGKPSRKPFRVSSTPSESTVMLQPSSNSLAGTTSKETLDVSQFRSGINFRELNAATRRAPLTEREKAEIWDDLLERSAQAGGTLHLGAGGQLESDNLRYSSCSEVSRS